MTPSEKSINYVAKLLFEHSKPVSIRCEADVIGRGVGLLDGERRVRVAWWKDVKIIEAAS